jgi:outer membrane beta-barrel protein
MNSTKLLLSLVLCVFNLSLFSAISQAQETAGLTKVDISQVQQKYLANTSNEIQVVQNRKYTKVHKFELGITGGLVSADPFVNDSTLGGFLGYHFSESFGIRAFYWKDFTSKNDAFYAAKAQSNLFVNTNSAQSFIGGELKFIPIYGKVSILGSSILYYDLNLFVGGGIRKTDSGSSFSPVLGIGEQFFFAKCFALGVDYRLMYYKENIIDQQPASATYGGIAGSRTNFTHNVMLSLSWLIGKNANY